MWFQKNKLPKAPREARTSKVPEGLWTKCEGCKEIIYTKEIVKNLRVCPKCSFHFRLGAAERLDLLFDDARWVELDGDLRSSDPLRFKDTKKYRDRLRAYEDAVGPGDAVLSAQGTIEEIPTIVCAMEYSFMGGSMGSVVGEKITRGAERAAEDKLPLVVVACSGGARMQEGILSLMQMAKISAALGRLAEMRLPYLSVLTDPTTGGVTASFAMLGDLNIAEPQALIGFAGPRVIEQTIRQTLPAGFQRSEYLIEHGMIDIIVDRSELKATVARSLRLLLPAS